MKIWQNYCHCEIIFWQRSFLIFFNILSIQTNGTAISIIHFKAGVYAWGTTPANFTLAIFTTVCPTGFERELVNEIMKDEFVNEIQIRVCGSSYDVTPSDPKRGECQQSSGKCSCSSAESIEWPGTADFVGKDCTGVAARTRIFPPPSDPADMFGLQVVLQ